MNAAQVAGFEYTAPPLCSYFKALREAASFLFGVDMGSHQVFHVVRSQVQNVALLHGFYVVQFHVIYAIIRKYKVFFTNQ